MFDAEKVTNEIVEFVRNYFKTNNIKGCVIGISGGKDSAVCAGLMVRAIGKDNVIGVTMPCHSNNSDMEDAKLISDYYGFELINAPLTDVFDEFKKSISINYSGSDVKNSDINLKPRLRMSMLYYLAALYSSIKKGTYLVCGTSNKCELYTGYFTKGGDSVHDISLLSDLSVSEVISVGEYLDVPRKVLYKAPSDGISGYSDEDKLGVKYSDIEKYLNNEKIDENIKTKIEKLHNNNLHKFNIPSYKKGNYEK